LLLTAAVAARRTVALRTVKKPGVPEKRDPRQVGRDAPGRVPLRWRWGRAEEEGAGGTKRRTEMRKRKRRRRRKKRKRTRQRKRRRKRTRTRTSVQRKEEAEQPQQQQTRVVPWADAVTKGRAAEEEKKAARKVEPGL
jgi:hypothetical protein